MAHPQLKRVPLNFITSYFAYNHIFLRVGLRLRDIGMKIEGLDSRRIQAARRLVTEELAMFSAAVTNTPPPPSSSSTTTTTTTTTTNREYDENCRSSLSVRHVFMCTFFSANPFLTPKALSTLSPKTARKGGQSPNSATVALFCDSRHFRRQIVGAPPGMLVMHPASACPHVKCGVLSTPY